MFISALLFGISASLDSLLVGVSYGIRGIRVRFWQNMVISLITLLGTCLSVGLGQRLAPFLPEIIRNYAGSLILILLGFYYIAKWAASLLRSRPSNASPDAASQHEENTACAAESALLRAAESGPVYAIASGPACAEASGSLCTMASGCACAEVSGCAYAKASAPQLKPAEVFTLSLTLSLNNLSAGLSASLAGLTLLPTAVSTLICSIFFLLSGNRLGRNPVLQLAGRAADPLSGALLIGLGLVQFFLA